MGYRDSAVLDRLQAMYGASREMRWALKGVERKLNEEKERKKAGMFSSVIKVYSEVLTLLTEDLEQELSYYRGWDKRRTVSDYTT